MITGQCSPKFVVDGIDMPLDHWITSKDEPVYDNLIHKSVITGAQKIIVKGYHWGFEGDVNLWKYAKDNPPVDPMAKYLELFNNLYKTGTLYRHRDHDPIKNSAGGIVDFILIEIVPYYKKFGEIIKPKYDAAIVKFISSAYVDITQSAKQSIVNADGFIPIINLDGNQIIG